jgi:predicted choloylglycine hydrolase
MNSRRILPLLALLASLAAPAPARAAAAPFRFPAGRHGKAELKYVNGIPVLIVSGTPREIGSAVGALALKPARRVVSYPRGLLKALDLDRTWALFLNTGKAMFKQFPEPYQEELEAMVRAARVERDGVIAGNTFFDLKKFLACSAVLVSGDRSATGGPLLARNLDYPSLGYIHQYSLVTVYRPRGKHAFATVGFPGLVGALSGINDAGLALGVLEVFDVKSGEPHFDVRGIPYGLCLRTLLAECRTIAEAQKKLEGMKRTTTINVIIADRKGVAVLEVTPGRVVRRDPEKGVCPCTNHFCTATLKPDKPVNVDNSFERFATLAEVRTWKGKADREQLRKQLDACNLGNLTLQTMVFEPATLRLHLSIGKTPASRGPLRTLDLTPLFKAGKPRKDG